jgi:hypothetical protein
LIRRLPDFDALVANIEATVAPKTWGAVGGPGCIEPWPGAIVVAQSYPVHRQLQRKYAQMMQPAVGGKPVAAARRSAQGNRRLLNALEQPSPCDFNETPLQEVTDHLAERHRINIVIDEQGLGDVGLSTRTPVTCKLGGVKLGSALNLMLGQIGLTWTVDKRGLTITTEEENETRLTQVTYDVRDLLTVIRGNIDLMLTILTNTVAPKTWNEVGGAGSVTVVPGGGLLVKQTFRNHRRIQRLLDDLRQVHRR